MGEEEDALVKAEDCNTTSILLTFATVDLINSKLIDLGITDMKKRIETINSIIKYRGEKMAYDLNQYMGDSIWN